MNCWFMHTGVIESWWNDGIKLLLTVNVKLCMYIHTYIYIIYISKAQQIAIINFICTTLVLKNMKYIFVFLSWTTQWCGSYDENVAVTIKMSSQWRHNERNGVSNHQPHDYHYHSTVYLGADEKKTPKNPKAPCHWPLCGNSPVTSEFPAQMASSAENASIWWRHHGVAYNLIMGHCFSQRVMRLLQG